MNKVQITVFTPTYNRGYIIENLYKSLQRQSCNHFEWLVIDDASDDGTQKLFDEWMQEENKFSIRYYRRTVGGGKHRAINEGVKLAQGSLFFIVDSDDTLADTAVQKLIEWDAQIEKKENFAGISGNKGYSDTELVGTTFSGNYVDASYTERVQRNINGDKAEAYYTEVLCKYPFPEFEGERFLTERVVWDKIGADGYKIRWYNDIIYFCEYLPDGLSRNGDELFRKNPKGAAYNLLQMMQIYHYSPIKRLQSINGYIDFMKPIIPKEEICRNLNITKVYYSVCQITGMIYRMVKRGRKK